MSSNVRTQAVFTAIGIGGFTLAFVIGWILLARFALPAPSPAWSADQLAAFYVENKNRIRLGCVVALFFLPLFALPLGVVLARLRRTERGTPVFTYASLVLMPIALFLLILPFIAWSVAAFRPEQLEPQITQTLNDLGWFIFLFTWAVFTVLFTLLAIAILRAETGSEPLPRWSAYLLLWCGLLFAGSALIIFFKDGPFAYDGLVGLYIPVVATAIFQAGMFVALAQALLSDYRAQTGVSTCREQLKPTVS
ncbi:hypothetical protein BKG69_13005 [Mycobacteroides chelonae]|uniref:Uncharacterized protein n=1 Tax=[Mycobacterium] stephanolepidis TaxID=1520670 RepID=A0A1Z4F3M2_9MYCO|nr:MULTISPECIES: hypothetical protein [Mycobacteroides]OHT79308.1 hypothetical protein BKG69_13005 [Mycobacteroides chelonae]BAX99833.1 hypothetical protein MSTE_04540 [[Mycobacterium] stephanolepidis]